MNKQKLKLWGKRLAMAVCLLVLCVNLITLVLNALDLRDSLGWLPYGVHTVESGSMEPAISKGDLILVKQVPFADLKVGDDVTFITTEGFVTHRLMAQSGTRFVTQGLANEIPDPLPMGPESYCGKVIAVIPLLGSLLSPMSASVWPAVLVCLLILMIGLGQPLLKKLLLKEQTGKVSYARRALVCAAAMSLLVSIPTMSEAKYLTKLSRYELAVAQPMYFSSNYLSQGGNVYSIQGWSGDPYALYLEIKNSDNALLYNSQDMNLVYGVAVELLDDSQGKYTVSLSVSESDTDRSVTAAEFPYPESWAGFEDKMAFALPGGSQLKHGFNILIQPKEGYTAAAGEEVRFAIHACTSETETYFKELKGTFHLTVAETTDFLGQTRVEDNGSLVSLSMTTNLVNDGSEGEKLVCFRWDPAKLYINEYERTAFNAINSAEDCFKKEEGLLYMRLQAYSKIELEFFKKGEFTVDNWDFAIAVVDSMDEKPEFAARPQEPTPTQVSGT